jgi:hydrogenase expression/formation protein HypC
MCLAVPGKVIECSGQEALVDFQGNRLKISKVLTPEAQVGDWVLVHAGFAISQIEEQDALETWSYLRDCYGPEADQAIATEGAGP